MRSTPSAFVASLLLGVLPMLAGAEDSLRCPAGLVAVGDWKIDLLGKCGEPTLREAVRSEGISVTRDVPGQAVASQRDTPTVERWTYDFGRSQFIQIVTIEGGRVRSIDRSGRGYADSPAGTKRAPIPVARCDYMSLRVGETAYEVLSRCGDPATRDVRILERVVELAEGGGVVQRSISIPMEVWTYHFGPQTLIRVLELESGKVVRVETGGHGYPP
jgi:hypothetical protein